MTAALTAAGIFLGFVIITGAVFAHVVLGWNPLHWHPLRHRSRARRHRRESVSHPEQVCYYCHGESTALIWTGARGVFGAPGEIARFRCKDRKLCEATRELKKLLDSTA
jgi:hypothetical protein